MKNEIRGCCEKTNDCKKNERLKKNRTDGYDLMTGSDDPSGSDKNPVFPELDPEYSMIGRIGLPDDIVEYYQKAGIRSLYPPQAAAVEAGLLKGKNILAAIPTASGKTLLAELAMIRSIRNGGKALYIVPLRALASEKYRHFRHFESYGISVGMSTGDLDKKEEYLGAYDIIVATSEKVDSLLRNETAWLGRISVLVLDEVHLIDSRNRGPTLEITIIKMRHLNPKMQIVALSATIGNTKELAGWLNAVPVESSWRPTRLREGVFFGGSIWFENDEAEKCLPEKTGSGNDGQGAAGSGAAGSDAAGSGKERQTSGKASPKRGLRFRKKQERKKFDPDSAFLREIPPAGRDGDAAVSLSADVIREGGQALIFENSRRNATAVAVKAGSVISRFLTDEEKEILRDQASEILDLSDTETAGTLAACIRSGVAFHHAGLTAAQREIVEQNFLKGRLKVIASTPTLAAGLNLPARRVIIRNYRRYDADEGMVPIPVLEYKQMAGRAGRPHLDPYGEAILLGSKQEEVAALYEHYIYAGAENITSGMGAENTMRTHVLSIIVSGFADTRASIVSFFKDTFFAYREGQMSTIALNTLVVKCLDFLTEKEMIHRKIPGETTGSEKTRDFRDAETPERKTAEDPERKTKKEDPEKRTNAENQERKTGAENREKKTETENDKCSISGRPDSVKTGKKNPFVSADRLTAGTDTGEKEKTISGNPFVNASLLRRPDLSGSERVSAAGFSGEGERFVPTNVGSLVSRLYIDPMSAALILEGLHQADLKGKELSTVGLLQLICSTPDIHPLYLKKADYETVEEFIVLNRETFAKIPDRDKNPDEYEWFMCEVKTAMMLYDWTREISEDEIIGRYDVGEGDIRSVSETAEWICGSAARLASLTGLSQKSRLSDLELSLRYGASAELLSLLRLRGVGRVRARRLYNAGIRVKDDLMTADPAVVAGLVGPATAGKIFSEIGRQISAADFSGVRAEGRRSRGQFPGKRMPDGSARQDAGDRSGDTGSGADEDRRSVTQKNLSDFIRDGVRAGCFPDRDARLSLLFFHDCSEKLYIELQAVIYHLSGRSRENGLHIKSITGKPVWKSFRKTVRKSVRKPDEARQMCRDHCGQNHRSRRMTIRILSESTIESLLSHYYQQVITMAAKTGPIIVLDPGKEETKGRDALLMNINAAKTVASLVQSTLGPKGMDKMLVNSLGIVTMTNDGATILKDIGIEHPAAKMVVEVAKSLENTAGDGTTSSVVFTGALMDKAEMLIGKGFHPSVIIKGYQMAEAKALEILNEKAMSVGPEDREILRKVAMTALTGKASENDKEHLADVCVDAVSAIQKDGFADIRNNVIQVVDLNREVSETELIKGVALTNGAANKTAPTVLENAKIVLFDAVMDDKLKNQNKMYASSPEERAKFAEYRTERKLEVAKTIVSLGANVVLTTKAIPEIVTNYLDKNGIFVSRPIEEKDLEHVAYAVNARLVRNPRELSAEDVGVAEHFRFERINDSGKIYITGGKASGIATIVVRAQTVNMGDSVVRALDDALGVVKSVVEDKTVVAGGGASEMEVSLGVRAYATTVRGYEQRVILAFAEAIEELPKLLAKNAGLDTIDSLIALRAAHASNKNAGLNVYTGDVTDMMEAGVVDPLRVKINTVKSAVEASVMILRIDDVLKAKYKTMLRNDTPSSALATSFEGMAPPNMNERR